MTQQTQNVVDVRGRGWPVVEYVRKEDGVLCIRIGDERDSAVWLELRVDLGEALDLEGGAS